MLDNFKHWLSHNDLYFAGAGAGTGTGVVVSGLPTLESIVSLIGSFSFVLISGFLGAWGAHLFKKLIERLNNKKNG